MSEFPGYEILELLAREPKTLLAWRYLDPPETIKRLLLLELIEVIPVAAGRLPYHEVRLTEKGRLCALDRDLFDKLHAMADAYLKEGEQRKRDFYQASMDALRDFRVAEQEAIDEAAKRHEFRGRAK